METSSPKFGIGKGFVIKLIVSLATHPLSLVTVTMYSPAVFLTID